MTHHVIPKPHALGDRTKYVGWSDIGSICGHNNRESGYRLAQKKLGHIVEEDDEKEALVMGRALEPVIADAYVRLTGNSIEQGGEVVHPELPWLIGHPDYIVRDYDPNSPTRYLECKATRLFDDWGEAGTDDVPKTALCQGLAGTTIMGLDYCDFGLLRYTTQPEVFYMGRDDELWKAILRKVVAWHQLVLVERKLPDPETLGDYKIAFPEHTPGAFGTYDAESMREDFDNYRTFSVLETEAKKRKAAIKKRYVKLIGAAEGIAYFDEEDSATMVPVVTYKKSKGRFNVKAFKAYYPYLHAQFTDEVGPRLFNICSSKEALAVLGEPAKEITQ